jgi:hypothetical protein
MEFLRNIPPSLWLPSRVPVGELRAEESAQLYTYFI